MKVVVVLINKGNYVSQYIRQMIAAVNERKAGVEIDWTILGKYPWIDQDKYDVLIYNTFPDEGNTRKFDPELTARCDWKFHSFGGLQILLDTHDNGSKDGFTRFKDYNLPRIKANPSYDLMEKMNLIMTVPYFVYPEYCQPQAERPFNVLCAMRMRNMPPARRETLDRIRRFDPMTEWLPLAQHAERLCRTLINVVPTGIGDSSRSHTDTLAAGALLMAEEGIKGIKLLPHADLKDGESFVSYNLDNICDKLDSLLADRTRLDEIRHAGLEAFRKGYDLTKSADQLLGWLNETH